MLPQKSIVPPTPLTDAEVLKTLKDMEDVIRYRLRMTEIVPVEMAKYRIGMVTGRLIKRTGPDDIL